MTKQQAFQKAKRLSMKMPYSYVVFEDGEYDALSEYEMDEYMHGTTPIAVFSSGERVD